MTNAITTKAEPVEATTEHAWAWYSVDHNAGYSMLVTVWPVGCTREEAMQKTPMEREGMSSVLLRIPLDRAWAT